MKKNIKDVEFKLLRKALKGNYPFFIAREKQSGNKTLYLTSKRGYNSINILFTPQEYRAFEDFVRKADKKYLPPGKIGISGFDLTSRKILYLEEPLYRKDKPIRPQLLRKLRAMEKRVLKTGLEDGTYLRIKNVYIDWTRSQFSELREYILGGLVDLGT